MEPLLLFEDEYGTIARHYGVFGEVIAEDRHYPSKYISGNPLTRPLELICVRIPSGALLRKIGVCPTSLTHAPGTSSNRARTTRPSFPNSAVRKFASYDLNRQ